MSEIGLTNIKMSTDGVIWQPVGEVKDIKLETDGIDYQWNNKSQEKRNNIRKEFILSKKQKEKNKKKMEFRKNTNREVIKSEYI